ncbi:MFS transporter [Streptomyces sp. SAJ15]|uniref:MFS transporter n=1 Tax=Streptomyces sp. SAJ15 TaxID=2011095 RepID=UPI0011848720|nr:MFS transporter [Streptomyces sp. SAJ15]TVL94282.1 MFS transporter [Streptomyces sp. SAJ15]
MTTPSLNSPRRAGRREWTAFVVLMLPLLLVSMDVSVLYFAIPAISRELDLSGTQQLWIFDIYAFALAGLLITMGSLGDRIGRRKLLLLGAAAFGAASVAAAYAQSAEMLIAARALLGIGGATLMPSTMALVRNLFQDPGQRAAAVGIWSGVMTAGVALGSVLSGVMLSHFWWGSIFLINVPAMVLLLVLAPILVPEFKDPAPGRFDLPSVPLSMGAVLPVIYGLKKIAADGFATTPALAIGAGLVLGLLFVRRQLTRRDPMINPALFRNRGFGSAAALNAVAMFAMMGSTYFTTQYLQSVLGQSPLEAALWSLAPSLLIGCAAPVATMLVQRGVRRAHVVAGGFVLAAVGLGVLTLADTDSLWTVLLGCGVSAAGIVTVMSTVTDLALGITPPRTAGSAASLLETGQEFGGALGMAALGSVGNAVYRHDVTEAAPAGLPADTLDAVRETLGNASVLAGGLPGRAGEALLTTAREAFTHGMQLAAATGALVLLAAAVLATVTLRNVGDRPTDAPSADPERPETGPTEAARAELPEQNTPLTLTQ